MCLVHVDRIVCFLLIRFGLGLHPTWDATGSDWEWQQALSNGRAASPKPASIVAVGGSAPAATSSGTKPTEGIAADDLDLEAALRHPARTEYSESALPPKQGTEYSESALPPKQGLNQPAFSKVANAASSAITLTDQHDGSPTGRSVQPQMSPERNAAISTSIQRIENIMEQGHRENSIEAQPLPPSPPGPTATDVVPSAESTASVSQRTIDEKTQSFDKTDNSDSPSVSKPSESSASSGMKKDFPWYHTEADIHAQLVDLSTNCDKATAALTSTTQLSGPGDDYVKLDVVRVSKGKSGGKKKAFFVFGEHAREVVSPESALHFLRTLCGKTAPANEELLDRVLATTDFVVVPNANPMGRKQVEDGNYCKRTNENGVDLNRNWGDEHRETMTAALKEDEKNPGPGGFSETESKMLKDLVEEETPDIYLSVHSGAYLLGTPFGYSELRTAENEKDMLEVLKPISQKVCNGNCPYGDMAHLIGYDAGGCDIDYVKETLGTPYVFTWEIYAGGGLQKYFAEEAHARMENRQMNEQTVKFFDRNGQGFLQRGHKSQRYKTSLHSNLEDLKPESQQNPAACFRQFNPESQLETEEVTQNWSEAYLMLCDGVVKHSSKSL